MTIWRAILLVYERVEISYPGRWWLPRKFSHTLSKREVADAVMSFQHFPGLVADLTGGKATVEYKVVKVTRTLDSLTREPRETYWPSPNDTRRR